MLHDGELSIRAARNGRKHLESCWTCRYRAEELRSTVFSFVEFCDNAVAWNAPSQNFTNNFQRRLRQQADQKSGQPKRALSIYDRLSVFATPRALTTLATIACLLYVSLSSHLVPAAKATETLRNAKYQEMESVGKLPNSVVHQRLKLSSDGRDLHCELWRTASGGEARSTCDGDPQFNADLSKVYSANRWDHNRPMSPAVFLNWRTRANASIAEFHRDNARDVITIRYRMFPWVGHSTVGTIREASITLASRTLHSLEQSLRVWTEGGEREIRFRELSYDIVPYSRTPFAAVSAPEVKPAQQHKKPAPPLPVVVSSVSNDDLENAEVQLRSALHQLHADIEMTPEIVRQGGRIVLRMIVDNEQVQRAVVSAVSSIPLVDAEVWTPENAPQSFRLAVSADLEGTGRIYRTSATQLESLSKCLKSPEAAADYVEQVQRSIREVMVPALALRRLSERYPETRYGLVPAPSRITLDTVAVDYIRSLQESSAQLRKRLAPILTGCGFAEDGQALEVLNQQPARNWRAAAPQLERQIRELESAFNQLFTTRESMQAPLTVSEALERIAVLSNDLSNINPRAFQENSKAGHSTNASAKKQQFD